MAVSRVAFNDLTVDDVLLGDFREFHVAIAKTELARAQRDPSWRKYQTFTDNRLGKPARNVSLFGKIEFANENLREVIEYIWTQLNLKGEAIRLDGDYLADLRMYVPGSGTFQGFQQVPDDAQEVHFYTVSPYARKVELGQSIGAKGGVFKPIYRSASRLFGRNVKLTFSYTVPRDGTNVSRSNRKRAGYSAPVPSPVIYLKQGGFFR